LATRHPVAIVWLRRDLRLDDHLPLRAAALAADRVVLAFVLDPVLLRSERMGGPIVQFFFESLAQLREQLRRMGSDLALLEGDFARELPALAARVGATAVYYGSDTDPAASARDADVTRACEAAGLAVHAYSDQVYYSARDVVRADGEPYSVYTPYRRRWEARLAEEPHPPVDSRAACAGRLLSAAQIGATRDVPSPEDFGYASSPRFPQAGEREAQRLLAAFVANGLLLYADCRNEPAVEGTSRLSPHLRAGTIGIRTCVHAALDARDAVRGHARSNAERWLSELIWRDFYHQVLVHHPHTADQPFIDAARAINYIDDDDGFAAWCEARTGYPIVDAAMRQLNATGWMHNRLRMVVASFLTKHLLIDYRRGISYFEQRLADADLAANNGGWQWSASVGTDPSPYFRVFNPILQGKNFDPHGTFVRTWLPVLRGVPAADIHAPWNVPPLMQAEYGCVIGTDYPEPIVDHAFARERALAVYGAALKKKTV
jgi:deoxyribodipyrimidine photo-lyase